MPFLQRDRSEGRKARGVKLPAALPQSGGLMPSSEYYRRQANTLLALAVNTSDADLSTRYQNLAIEYKLLAEKRAADPLPADPATTIQPGGTK
jgi:hypothetical protein